MTVVIVGSNPSEKSPDNSPFHPSTRSRMTVDAWFSGLDIDIRFENVCDRTCPRNRPMRVSEIKDNLESLMGRISSHGDCKIVALGRTAEKALSMLSMDHISIPHPSGANRFWNNKSAATEVITKLRTYVTR
jgi:uracil-DNA glycosylase